MSPIYMLLQAAMAAHQKAAELAVSRWHVCALLLHETVGWHAPNK